MSQSILIYGESGVYKTTQIGLFARYQYEKTGRVTRLVTCDSGLGPCQDEVNEGYIIPIRLEATPHPVAVMNKLSKGLWPVRAIDERAGIYDINSGFSSVVGNTGAYAIEGLTRLSDLARKTWTDEQRSMGEPLQGVHEVMGEKFAFQSRGTIGGIHQFIANVVLNFRALNVDRVLFTGHEGKGKDIGGRSVFGPATIGQALTDKITGWFEIALHHESYTYQDPNSKELRSAVRAWFSRHPDIEMPKMFWPAKLGVSPRLTAHVNKLYPYGYIPLIMNPVTGEYTSGFHTFLYFLDQEIFQNEEQQAADAAARREYMAPSESSSEQDNQAQAPDDVAMEAELLTEPSAPAEPETDNRVSSGRGTPFAAQTQRRTGRR